MREISENWFEGSSCLCVVVGTLHWALFYLVRVPRLLWVGSLGTLDNLRRLPEGRHSEN